jgi:ESS family glutamate:Na+ symporter
MESFLGLCLLLGLGYVLRTKVRLLQRLYLPSSVIAGLIGLGVIQLCQARGAPIPPEWTAGWRAMPGKLISVVFACLFLGVTIPGARTLWRRAGPQLAYGQIVAWGQYVVGLGLTLVVLGPLFGMPAMFGAIIPVGFEGGHGTAAGLRDTFAELEWAAGGDFAQASATAGIGSALIVGMILINWATRRGHTAVRDKPARLSEAQLKGVIPHEQRPSAGRLPVSADAIESFSLQLVFIGVAIFLGWLMQQGIRHVPQWCGVQTAATDARTGEVLRTSAGKIVRTPVGKILYSFPLFPLAMLGGLIVQLWEQKFDRHRLIGRGLMRRIQGMSLDFLIVAAVATIDVRALIPSLAPFLLLVAAGIAWNVFCVTALARRLLPDVWFERSIAEMGQSMGVTATGLVLLRAVDPDYETPAAEAFAEKQLMHEPFMGGGLWTSSAIPLIFYWGALPVFSIACGAVGVWLAVILLVPGFRPRLKPA